MTRALKASRIRETIGNIVGLLYAKDLLKLP